MRSTNPLLDRVKTLTPRSIPSRLCEKKPLVPTQNIAKPVLGVLSGKKSPTALGKVVDAFRQSSPRQ